VTEHPEFIEDQEWLYLNVFFSYVVSILFKLPFYLNHEHLDRVNTNSKVSGAVDDWKKVFHFFLHKALPLSTNDSMIMVNYRELPNQYGLSSEVIVCINFEDAYEIFLDNYELYAAKVHMHLGSIIKALNRFEPKQNYYLPNKINIAIDLSHFSPALHAPEKEYFQESKNNHELRMSNWEYLKVNKINEDDKRNGHSTFFNLINQIKNEQESQTNKDFEIHIFSDSDQSLFKELLSNIDAKTKINLHLNVPAVEKFYFFTVSDYLICDNNVLSWLATLVNPNPSIMKFPFKYITAPTTRFFDDGLSLFKDQRAEKALSKNLWVAS
jgi:hypothetical protein